MNLTRNFKIFAIVMGLAIAIVADVDANACSRMVWTTKGQGVFAARSMDWGHSFDDVLFINPRGRKMDGGSSENTLNWTTKYGNVVSSPTWWTSVTDLERKRYYFNWAKSANIVWIDIDTIDFSEGTGKRVIDPKKPALVGNISDSFTPVTE